MASINTQPPPSSLPFSSLQGEQISVSGLYMAQRQYEITPKDNYQYQ